MKKFELVIAGGALTAAVRPSAHIAGHGKRRTMASTTSFGRVIVGKWPLPSNSRTSASGSSSAS